MNSLASSFKMSRLSFSLRNTPTMSLTCWSCKYYAEANGKDSCCASCEDTKGLEHSDICGKTITEYGKFAQFARDHNCDLPCQYTDHNVKQHYYKYCCTAQAYVLDENFRKAYDADPAVQYTYNLFCPKVSCLPPKLKHLMFKK